MRGAAAILSEQARGLRVSEQRVECPLAAGQFLWSDHGRNDDGRRIGRQGQEGREHAGGDDEAEAGLEMTHSEAPSKSSLSLPRES